MAALVRHLTAQDLRNFLASARGEASAWQAPADELGQDWAADFRDRAARLMAVWQQADLDHQLPLPGGGHGALRSRADQQIAELAMNGWDLVMATGQQTGLDPALAEHALRWSRQMLRPGFRGPDRAFGPEVPVPAGRAGLPTAGRLVRPRPQLDATRQHVRSPTLTRCWPGRSTPRHGRTLPPARSPAGPG